MFTSREVVRPRVDKQETDDKSQGNQAQDEFQIHLTCHLLRSLSIVNACNNAKCDLHR